MAWRKKQQSPPFSCFLGLGKGAVIFPANTNNLLSSGFHFLSIPLSPFHLCHWLFIDKVRQHQSSNGNRRNRRKLDLPWCLFHTQLQRIQQERIQTARGLLSVLTFCSSQSHTLFTGVDSAVLPVTVLKTA